MRNFISKQIFLLFLTFGYAASNEAQILSGNCSSVTLNISYPEVYIASFLAGCSNGSPCCKVTNQTLQQLVPQFNLMQKQANGIFTSRGAFQSYAGGLPHGTYRADITKRPIYHTTADCSTVSLQSIGQSKFLGNFNVTPLSTNEFVVGATLPSEVKFSYVDNTNGMSNGWDVNEAMKINTTGSINYDRWWLAVFEQGGANRYKSKGWTFGTMPTEIDLKEFWGLTSGWTFQQGTNYYIQFAASSSCNSSWVEANGQNGSDTQVNTFFVCGNGWGCRTAPKEEVVVSPNPANSFFRVFGIEDLEDNSLSLTDLSGRVVQSFSNIANQDLDISALPSGIYLAHIWNGAKKIKTSKISIIR